MDINNRIGGLLSRATPKKPTNLWRALLVLNTLALGVLAIDRIQTPALEYIGLDNAGNPIMRARVNQGMTMLRDTSMLYDSNENVISPNQPTVEEFLSKKDAQKTGFQFRL